MPTTYTPPVESVFCGALALLHIHEHGGNNRGEMIELMLRDVHEFPGAPWCAAYIHRAGHYALLDPITNISRWPLPDTASCQTLADFAATRGILSFVPIRGDLFVLRPTPHTDFHHTGFIWSVTDTPDGYHCTTIEGNTITTDSPNSLPPDPESGQVTIRTRIFPHGGTTRFIDWPRLLNEA